MAVIVVRDKRTKKTTGNGHIQCFTCNKSCKMSGLCLEPWPEFKAREEKKGGKE